MLSQILSCAGLKEEDFVSIKSGSNEALKAILLTTPFTVHVFEQGGQTEIGTEFYIFGKKDKNIVYHRVTGELYHDHRKLNLPLTFVVEGAETVVDAIIKHRHNYDDLLGIICLDTYKKAFYNEVDSNKTEKVRHITFFDNASFEEV